MASKEIFVPELGDFKDVAVIEVLVKAGESVQVDTPLLTLETEKATIDVPSPDAGVIEQLHVAKGSKVSTGTLIATLQLAAGATPAQAAAVPAAAAAAPKSPAKPAAPVPDASASATAPQTGSAVPAPAVVAESTVPVTAPATAPAAAPAASTPPPINEDGFARAHAGPSVRRFARELGVDLGRVKGSGQKGRVTDDDVKAFVKSLMVPGAGAAAADAAGGSLPKVNVPDFAQFGAIDIQPLGRVQRISGARLHASWVNLPHVTQFDEAD
ncbi:MAG TPA: biotin/lipoyl-containing protein, partial [Steroidobacteraceae bacterium]